MKKDGIGWTPDELKHHPGPGEEGRETTPEPAAEATAETGDKAPE